MALESSADRWVTAVEDFGSYWTIDSFVGDASIGVAVIEWTHFKRKLGVILRGDEWYQFDLDSGLIEEIRAYYAAPQDPTLAAHELDGVDYASHAYLLDAPDLGSESPGLTVASGLPRGASQTTSGFASTHRPRAGRCARRMAPRRWSARSSSTSDHCGRAHTMVLALFDFMLIALEHSTAAQINSRHQHQEDMIVDVGLETAASES